MMDKIYDEQKNILYESEQMLGHLISSTWSHVHFAVMVIKLSVSLHENEKIGIVNIMHF